MKRSALALLVVLAACGATASLAAAPKPLPGWPGITIQQTGKAGGDAGRIAGRRWRSCGTTIYNTKSAYDYYGIVRSGRGRCAQAHTVFAGLARQVERRQNAGQDCFPGYCTADKASPTTVGRYRCRATNFGDVSIARFITCRRGDRYVGASVADDE